MLEIFLFYIWAVIGLFLSYVVLYRTYDKKGNKKKFPLFCNIVFIFASFIPVVNIAFVVGMAGWMYIMYDEDGVEYRNFLFKKH